MYQNEVIEDYIRSILGYPSLNNMYQENEQINYPMMNMQLERRQKLECCYPEIYQRVYPLITNRCASITEPITKELIDNMTDEIYSSIEVNNQINLNINLQNEKLASETKVENRTIAQKNMNRKETFVENRSESRQVRNSTLQDLIRILLIRELLNRNVRPRPNFIDRPENRPVFPNRPPMNQRRFNEYDLYE